MKALIFFFALAISATTSFAQKSDKACSPTCNKSVVHATSNISTPEKVASKFQRQYPNAQEVAWTNETEGTYTANFKATNSEFWVTYDAAGKKTATVQKSGLNILPSEVKNTLVSYYPGYTIGTVTFCECHRAGKSYTIDLQKDGSHLTLKTDVNGLVLQNTKNTENASASMR